MNTIQQVLHIWRKDWTRTRWSFLVLCASVSLSTAVSLPRVYDAMCRDSSNCGEQISFLTVLLCGLVTLLFIASVVQDDSPTDLTSFWRSQAISPRALLLAKLGCVFLAVVPLALIAQVIAMRANEIPLTGATHSLGTTFYWLGSFLLFGMLIASLSRGTQTFVLMVAGAGVIKLLATSGVVGFFSYRLAEFIQNGHARADVWIVTATATLMWTFLSRATRPIVRTGVVIGVLVLLTIGWDTGEDAGVRFLSGPRVAPDASLPKLRASVVQRDSGYTLRLETDAPPPGTRYALPCSNIAIKFADGRTDLIWPLGCYRNVPFALNPDTANPSVVSATFYLGFRKGAPDYPPSRTTALLFEGFLALQSVSPVGEMPSTNGARFVGSGVRFETFVADTMTSDGLVQRVYVDVLGGGEEPMFASFRENRNGQVRPGSHVQAAQTFSASGFLFRAVEQADTNQLRTNSPELKTTFEPHPLPIPAPSFKRSRTMVLPACSTMCPASWWKMHRIAISQWRQLSYVPVSAELPVQR